ncbi:MAG: nicotinamide-nucleotide amidohydrolase family protein [Clostridiales bacterium]|nr:nicotinamide-nucleotide amidohydrolase family protein [Clostridiales bacterium]
MKTVLMLFKSAMEKFDADYLKTVTDMISDGGVAVDVLDCLKTDDEVSFKHRVQEYKDTADNLIVLCPYEIMFDYKEVIAALSDTTVLENENAKKILDKNKEASGNSFPDEYAFLPLESTLIPNHLGGMQGFMMEENEFSLVVLPANLQELKPMCTEFVIPYFMKKYGEQFYTLTLKYFGNTATLDDVLEKAKSDSGDTLTYEYTTKNGDTLIKLRFPADTDRAISGSAVREIVSVLKEDIYAEFDTSLSERLFDLLRLKNKKLAVAESFTGGGIVSAMIKNSGVSAYLDEGLVTYSNKSKVERLNVKTEDLKKFGAVSSTVAYQMALGLLLHGEADIAIATTGIAGPKSDDTLKPVGLGYIAVGMRDGIHVYKYNFNGDREEITQTAVNTALHLAIKKLKNI